jgi:hypothetical protein
MKLEQQASRFGWTVFPYIVSIVVFLKLIEPITPNNVLDHGLELTVAGTILIFWLIFAFIGCLKLWCRFRGSELDEEQYIDSLARVRGLVLAKRFEDLKP